MRRNFTPALRRCAALFLALYCVKQLNAQVPTLVFQPVQNGLSAPVDIVNAGDGSNRIFIVGQGGTISVYDQSLSFLDNFLTVTGIVSGGEQGLLSLAFPPNYSSTGFFYVYYTSAPSGDVTIARYTRSATNINQADPGSRVILLSIPKPTDGSGNPFTNHNGGKLNFGPEGFLYFATGDGGSGNDPNNNAQDGSTLRGKMIRLDVSNPDPPFYFIPPDNPFTSDPSVRDEIWVLGLRNPWRWSFDKLTHDMWIGDVGQNAREEVDFRAAGTTGGINYGWRCFEGLISTPGVPDCTPANYVPPIFDYPHDATGGFAITGGYVYRGTEFPTLYGYYITGDWSTDNVWLILPNGSNTRQTGKPTSMTTFGEAEDGTIFAAAGGTMYKVAVLPLGPTPVKLISFTLRQLDNLNEINWKTAMESNVKEFSVQLSLDGVNFTEIGKVAPDQQPNGSTYSFKHFISDTRKLYYRLNTIDNDGSFEYSKIISTSSRKDGDPIKIYPQSGNSIAVELHTAYRLIQVINIFGQVVHKQQTGNSSGIIYLNTSGWAKGTYILIADNDDGRITRKFITQ